MGMLCGYSCAVLLRSIHNFYSYKGFNVLPFFLPIMDRQPFLFLPRYPQCISICSIIIIFPHSPIFSYPASVLALFSFFQCFFHLLSYIFVRIIGVRLVLSGLGGRGLGGRLKGEGACSSPSPPSLLRGLSTLGLGGMSEPDSSLPPSPPRVWLGMSEHVSSSLPVCSGGLLPQMREWWGQGDWGERGGSGVEASPLASPLLARCV